MVQPTFCKYSTFLVQPTFCRDSIFLVKPLCYRDSSFLVQPTFCRVSTLLANPTFCRDSRFLVKLHFVQFQYSWYNLQAEICKPWVLIMEDFTTFYIFLMINIKLNEKLSWVISFFDISINFNSTFMDRSSQGYFILGIQYGPYSCKAPLDTSEYSNIQV